jgi:hypothetical protein
MRMLLKKQSWAAGAVLTAALAAAGCGGTAAAHGTHRHATAKAHRAKRAGCPTGLLALGSHPAAGAERAAVRQAPELYANTTGTGKGINTAGVRATKALSATKAHARGAQIARKCGKRARRRTVVVRLFFPKMSFSGSLSEGVVFVGHFKDGYRVWKVAH